MRVPKLFLLFPPAGLPGRKQDEPAKKKEPGSFPLSAYPAGSKMNRLSKGKTKRKDLQCRIIEQP
jgi:hypothetical protein